MNVTRKLLLYSLRNVKSYLNKSTICTDAGWMEALADRVHKQGEHIPQHYYISHNHPYISSSDMLVGTISIFTDSLTVVLRDHEVQ